ncbi:uncharacterized protein KY384_007374 [Bacidia gigantensis]|uniref:uncharacterized protein n=1 Tax=Bacidia gigantensis TaxID=2732470 RepID=UPI001D059FB9|nr:uncharacterized protein KY384_007374 [Bacidia gigantensis]KAG8528456.1 hypothetical protein KY384_007374 [Bacidia gigantensis]
MASLNFTYPNRKRFSATDSIKRESNRVSSLFTDLSITPHILPYLFDHDITHRPLSSLAAPQGTSTPGHIDDTIGTPLHTYSDTTVHTLQTDGGELEKQSPTGTTPRTTSTSTCTSDLKPGKDPNLIEFSDLDPSLEPMRWSSGYKWVVTVIMAILTLAITFTSSMFSTGAEAVAEAFHISREVTVLGTSLYVVGFAFGPICWGPMSELFGRRAPLLIGVFGMSCLQIGVAVAQNAYTIFICRFLAGFFGCSPLAVIGGGIADIWDETERGAAMGLFAVMTFAGPVIAPVVGGFVVESYLGWRWTEWLTVIFGFFCLLIGAIFMPETYAPAVLHREAKRLRYQTKNWAIHSKGDENYISGKVILEVYLTRPFRMFYLEPILVLITLYMSLVYGILYLFFVAFPISFNEDRGWSSGIGSLPFLSLFIGVIVGGGYIAIWSKLVYMPKHRALNGRVSPEARLPPMFHGGIVVTIGMFWWAWSSFPDVKALWVSQCIAGIPIGAGIIMVFVQSLTYMVDCYKWLANSAIAANTFFRSLAGAGFPLFATAMFHTLGTQWATSVLGFLCAAMIPVPLIFYKYGKVIRRKSKFVPDVGP